MRRLLALALLGFTILAPSPARADGGDLLWQDQFDLAGGRDHALAIAATNARVVAVGSATTTDGNTDWVVRAYDAQGGALLWTDRLGAADSATAVVMDNQRVVVTGHNFDAATASFRTRIRAYVTKTGAVAWEDGWSERFAIGLAMGSERTVVAGAFVNAADVPQFRVRAYVTKSGAVAWNDESSPVPTGYVAGLFSVRGVVVRDGTAYVAASVGVVGHGGQRACLIRAYDVAAGKLLWQTLRDLHNTCDPSAIATDGQRVVITARTGIDGIHFLVQAHDAATGEFVWQDIVPGPSPLYGPAGGVAMTGRHTVVVGGRSVTVEYPEGTRVHEAFVVRSYDTATGALRWEDLHHPNRFGPFHWFGWDVDAVSGRLFAVGQEVEGNGTWLVRAYDAKRGDVLWEDEFQPAGGSAETQVLAVAGGRVFVAGSSGRRFECTPTGCKLVQAADMMIRAYDAR